MTAADQPSTEPSEALCLGRIAWEDLADLASDILDALHFAPGDRDAETDIVIDVLTRHPGLPAPQPAADTEAKVQWGVRSGVLPRVSIYEDEAAARRAASHRLGWTLVTIREEA